MAITIGIAGISGKFAKLLVTSLLQFSEVNIKGLCRDPAKVPESISSDPRVTLISGDAFDVDALRVFVSNCNVVVCCYLGDNKLMVDGQKLLIDTSEMAGVARYVASDWSIDYTRLELGQLVVKDAVIRLKAHLDAKTKIKGVHVLIGAFTEVMFSPPFAIWQPETTAFEFYGDGNEIWEASTYENAAEYTAAVCVDTSAVGIQRLVGGRASVRQIAESFAKVYGVRPTLKVLGSLEELKAKMEKQHQEQPENLFSYLPMYFQYYMSNGSTMVGPQLDNAKYPNVKPVTWEDFLKSMPMKDLAGSYQNR